MKTTTFQKAPLKMQLDALDDAITGASLERRTRQENIQKRIEDTRAELAGLEGKERNALLKGTEDELDEIINKKAILAQRIELLRLEEKADRLPDADKDGSEILKKLRDIDNESEAQTKVELAPLFAQIETILHARAEERSKIANLRQRCAEVYRLNSDTVNLYLLPFAGSVDCLTLCADFDRNQAFSRIKNGLL